MQMTPRMDKTLYGRRWLAGLAVLLLALAPVAMPAAEPASGPAGGPAVASATGETGAAGAVVLPWPPLLTAPAPWLAEPRAVLEAWLRGIVAGRLREDFAPVGKMFPVAAERQATLLTRLEEAMARLQTPDGFSFLGYRTLGEAGRLARLYYVTWHPLMPLAWEFVVYRGRSDGPWQLNFLRFESDAIDEFVALPPLAFERLRER